MGNVTVILKTEVPATSTKAVRGLAEDFKGLQSVTQSVRLNVNDFGSAASKAFDVLTKGAVVVGIAQGLKKSLDLTFEAESIRAVNAQFDLLADSAGIAGDKFKSGLVAAADGLIDDTDLIRIAYKSIVEMGKSAEKLPPIMDLARKATSVFGGELTENFDALAHAIATGQTKALKNLGIIIDSDAAYRDFALSIGVSKDELSEAGRQQAILNATLAQGEKAFAGVNVHLKENTDTFERLKVTLGQIGEVSILAFEKTAGPAIRRYLEGLTEIARDTKQVITANFGEGAEKAQASIELITAKLNETKAALIDLEQKQRRGLDFTPGDTASQLQVLPLRVQQYERELAAAKTELAKFNEEHKRTVAGNKAAADSFVDLGEKRRKLAEEGVKLLEQQKAFQEKNDPALAYTKDIEALRAALEEKRIAQTEYEEAVIIAEQARDAALQEKYAKEAEQLLEQNQRLREIDEQANLQRIDDNNRRLNTLLKGETLNARDRERVQRQLAAEEARINQERLAATADVLGKASTLFGEHTAAYRATASAEALISTYSGASKAAESVAFLGPVASAIAAGVYIAAGLKRVADINRIKLASGLTEVPPGFANDTFPASLSSGERVVNAPQNRDLTSFLESQGGTAELLAMIYRVLLQIAQQPVPAVISSGEVFNAVRDEINNGRRLPAA